MIYRRYGRFNLECHQNSGSSATRLLPRHYHPSMHEDATTVSRRLAQARVRIDPAEAEILLAHALGRPRSWLFAHGEATLDPAVDTHFGVLLERRVAGEPVAYLVGTRGFWTLDLLVSPATLVPRPETELLVEQALARIPAQAHWQLADLGTGCGAIALALASERPQCRVVATDLSAEALAVACDNAARNRIDNVEFRQGSWLEPLQDDRFDLIVSNPPYVADGDPHLAQGDLRFEPALALSCGSDGLNAIRTLATGAPARLRPGGWLLFEHGLTQGAVVRALLMGAGCVDVATVPDLEGRERVTLGRRP